MNGQMKAAVYERYGPPEVVGVRNVAKPIPGRKLGNVVITFSHGA